MDIVCVCVGEWGKGSRLEAWMKSHKSEVADDEVMLNVLRCQLTC